MARKSPKLNEQSPTKANWRGVLFKVDEIRYLKLRNSGDLDATAQSSYCS